MLASGRSANKCPVNRQPTTGLETDTLGFGHSDIVLVEPGAQAAGIARRERVEQVLGGAGRGDLVARAGFGQTSRARSCGAALTGACES